LKRLKRRRSEAEFVIGARRIGTWLIEPGIGARCIGIRAIERDVLPRPLICAFAIEAAKMHATTQPRKTDFLQFIAS
jgi:hypothetical protein